MHNPLTAKRFASVLLLVPGLAVAQVPEFNLAIRDHRFVPAEIRIPTGTKVRLVVANEDPTPEEFDSYALDREKVIAGRASAVIYVGPLKAGRYPFEGEFNAATAKGAVVAE